MSVGFVAKEDFQEGISRPPLDALDDQIKFGPESWVEDQSTLLEVATYTVMRRGEGDVFGYYRDGGEDRLHGQFSIGVGGHVEDKDFSEANPLLISAAVRENKEEVGVYGTPRYKGILFSTEDDVSSDHLGVWFEMGVDHVPGGEIDGSFETWDALHEKELETWSQMIFSKMST